MKIAIWGAGVVGQATGEGFARLGHEVYTLDKDPKRCKFPWSLWPDRDTNRHLDFVFFCVPETAIKEALYQCNLKRGIWVIRSSTTPGTIESLSKSINRPLLHNPEFLRAATALQDFLTPNYILIGAQRAGDAVPLQRLYEPFGVPMITTNIKVTEMVKLATNSYLATVIAYWNDISELCKKLGISSHEVGIIASHDPRLVSYASHMHNRYGGTCLPKDIVQLLTLAETLNVDVPVLEGVNFWSEWSKEEAKT